MSGTRRILYLQFTNPAGYPPLAHSSRILADRGWRVLFLGVKIPGVEDLVFAKVANVRTRLFPLVMNRRALGVKYLAFALWALWKTLWFRPHWIYASDSMITPVVLLLRKFFGARLVYHEHDSPDHARTRRARAEVARTADICIVPQPERAKLFERELSPPRKPLVVLNCPARAEIRHQREPRPAQPLRLSFQGSINAKRVPLALLRAMKDLPVELRILGYFPDPRENYRAELEKEATRLGIADRVQLVGALSRGPMLERMVTADVGLALLPLVTDDVNEKHMVGASNKAFENLSCGSPLLVPDLPDWKEWFVVPGYALACDPGSAESIATALRWFLDHPDERAEMGRRGRERCEKDWNYEFQFAPVLQILESQPTR